VTARKFYKTVFTVEVLSEEPLRDDMDLSDVDYMITEGGWSGIVDRSDTVELSGLEAARELQNQGSDPDFFCLDEDGNDAD